MIGIGSTPKTFPGPIHRPRLSAGEVRMGLREPLSQTTHERD